VVSKAPDFPKEVSDQEKIEFFRDIVSKMVQFFADSGLRCDTDGDGYRFVKTSPHWWKRRERPWTLVALEGDVRDAVGKLPSPLHVLLSLKPIPENIRADLRDRQVAWIEIARKEQSLHSNDLSDEVSNFLKRYGVRTLRVPAGASSPL
jgi:hypothetical protein